jgi:hypothetical protein
MKIFHCTLIVDECITHTALKHIFLFTIFLFPSQREPRQKINFWPFCSYWPYHHVCNTVVTVCDRVSKNNAVFLAVGRIFYALGYFQRFYGFGCSFIQIHVSCSLTAKHGPGFSAVVLHISYDCSYCFHITCKLLPFGRYLNCNNTNSIFLDD